MKEGKCENCGATMMNVSGGVYASCPTVIGCSRLSPRITPEQAVEWQFTAVDIPGLMFTARETKAYERCLRISKLPLAVTMPGPRGGKLWKYQGEVLYRIDGLDGLYARHKEGSVEAVRPAGADQWGEYRMAIDRFVKTNVVQRKKKEKT